MFAGPTPSKKSSTNRGSTLGCGSGSKTTQLQKSKLLGRLSESQKPAFDLAAWYFGTTPRQWLQNGRKLNTEYVPSETTDFIPTDKGCKEMAKATIISIGPSRYDHQDRCYVSECACAKVSNPKLTDIFYLNYYSENRTGETTWGLPMPGDNVQYFDLRIHKIVSRPVKWTKETVDFNDLKGKQKMRHTVSISGKNCGANPSIGQLDKGAIFKYPTGARLYMVLGNQVSYTCGEVAVVNLSNGDVYKEKNDKSCIPIDDGTEIVICVGAE